jgi:hypothetical protein
MASDLANADAVLQNDYLPVVREQVNQKAILLFGYTPEELTRGMGTANAAKGETLDYQGISRDANKVQFAGRKWIFTAHTKRNESGTMTSEDGALPSPGRQGWEDFEDRLRYAYKQIELTGQAIEVTESKVDTYVRLFEAETEGAINDLRWDLNRQAYGDQTGNLTGITADGSNTVTVTTVQYLRVGMPIDVVNSSTDAILGSRNITAINSTTKVVTYDGTDLTTTPGTHVLCLTGNWKKEMNGLRNIIDSTTYPTLHSTNGSSAGNEYWNGKRYDGTATTFDEDQGQQVLDDIGAEGWEAEIIITTRGVRRRYVNTLKAQKRFNDADSGKLHGGFQFIDFNGVPFLTDDQCPKGFMFFLRPQDYLWIWLNNNDFRWLQRDGKILRKVEYPVDKDNWRATVYRYNDLGNFRRKTQGMIFNLADDAAKVSS